jgi:hypothetical protein
MRKVRNPFTGELAAFPSDLGLTVAEREAVGALLEEAGAGEPDSDSYRRVELPDGSRVSVAVGTLGESAPCVAFAVECSALTAEVASFLHALTSRGNLSVGPTIDPDAVALPRPEPSDLVLRRWPKATVARSPSELKAWLARNLKAGRIV